MLKNLKLRIILPTKAFSGDISSNEELGGVDFYKRLVLAIKTTLLVVVELETKLTEIESVINDRILIYIKRED